MELVHADFAPSLVYNLTLAPEQENPWYRGVPQTISCDRFHRCPSRGYWVSKGRDMHLNKAFAADLILYGVVPGRLLIPIMKIKDPLRDLYLGFSPFGLEV